MNIRCLQCGGTGNLLSLGDRKVACLNCRGAGSLHLEEHGDEWLPMVKKAFVNLNETEIDLKGDRAWGVKHIEGAKVVHFLQLMDKMHYRPRCDWSRQWGTC